MIMLGPIPASTGLLLRRRAWLGEFGALSFFSASLAMIISNSCLHNGVEGFFEAEVF